MPAPPNTTETVEASDPNWRRVHRFRLRVVAGPDQGAVHTSSRERTIIGTGRSEPGPDFELHDRALSRLHCEITVEEDGSALIRDLRSRNGTFVNGVRVVAAYLTDGAVLGLGRSQIRFELAGEVLHVPLSEQERFGQLVGRSRAMRALFARLEKAAPTDITVLLQGETGTGKDVAAESIHRGSPRRDGPLVVVDCGAVAPGLLESELFGHERGAFTGAVERRVGAFEQASGGTLFLDEIGDLDRDLQPKLLRVLEAREVTRVGGRGRTPVDVRLVAATKRNLREEVNAGRFRADLYYRLAVMNVELPPLRERLEDLPLLVREILAGMHVPAEQAAALEAPSVLSGLALHAWPGNVRELRNHLERALVVADPGAPVEQAEAAWPAIDIGEPLRLGRERWVRFFERRYLEALLARHGGSVAQAAKAAGVDRIHLYRLIAKAGLK